MVSSKDLSENVNNRHRVALAKKVIDYWSAVEKFTPPKIETKNITGYGNLKSVQQEISGRKDIPWQSRERFVHITTPAETWVYTVFLGTIKCSDITTQMNKLLNRDDEYSEGNKQDVSCLCSFQLNNYGEIIPETFIVPDYFIYMSCLKQKNTYPTTWLSLAQVVNKKFTDAYDNKRDQIKNRNYAVVTYEDLLELVEDLIKLSDLTEFRNLKCNNLIIYSSLVPVPNNFKHDKVNGHAKFSDIKNYEAMLDEIKISDSNILNSFYIKDLDNIAAVMQSKKLPIQKSLKEYLEIDLAREKQDFSEDKTLFKEYSYPSYLPPTRWPNNPLHPLSLNQQIAVNLALYKDEGLFSINGPPGTGKSTLLRDIIAGVIFKRATALAKFDNPQDAFQKSSIISIKGYKYKIWQLDPSLLGHEIVIASSNNNAVENISKDIPKKN